MLTFYIFLEPASKSPISLTVNPAIVSGFQKEMG